MAHHPNLQIRLTTRRPVTFTLRRGEKLTTRIHAPDELEGPLPAGRRVGSVDVLYLGHRVKTLGLVTTRAVPATSVVTRVTDDLGPLADGASLAVVVLRGGASGTADCGPCSRAAVNARSPPR